MTMLLPLGLIATFERIADYWSPKVIGRLNDHLLKVAKLKGEFVWHAHDGQDELFHVVKGSLRIEFENEHVELSRGDSFVVPSGVRHKPIAREECWVLLIKPAATKHTGDEVTALTRSLAEQFNHMNDGRNTCC